MLKVSKNLDQWGPVDGVIFYPSFWFRSFAGNTMNKWGIRWPEMIGIFTNGKMTFFWDKREIQTWANKSISQWLLNELGFKKLHTDYDRLCKKLTSLSREIERTLSGGDKKNLHSLTIEWHKAYTEFWDNTSIFEIANFGSPEFLKKKISTYVPHSQLNNALEILLAPELLSFHQQSELELLKLYVFSSTKKNLKQKLQIYSKKWHWVNNSNGGSEFLNSTYFLNELNGISKLDASKKIEALKKYKKRIQASKKQLIQNYKIPASIVKVAGRLAYSIWWQDDRKAKVWWVNSLLDQMNKEAEKIFNISFDDLLWYSADEWRSLWEKRKTIPHRELLERKKFSVLLLGKNLHVLHTQQSAQKLAHPFLNSTNANDQKGKNLQGVVVSKGKGTVTGKIRIIHSPKNSDGFKKGEILVAPMTSPDYVPIMRKALAVITDVGGLMSHAAIISRELGIPCIVGTKYATKIFKNGDVVTLDISKGIVQKIN
jgi:phosphohistidine swiveling domain-containing protein